MGGVWKPPNAWFSAPAVGSKPIFFPKCWPIKELTRVWKLSLCARARDRNYDISRFPIGPKANGDSGCTRFLRLWSLLDFARGQGQQRRRYCHAHPPATMFRYRVIGGVEVRRPEALRASVSRTTIFIMPTRASVCSTGGRLQMVKISKRSVGKLKSYEH